ncbi:MAG: hypothetical protein GY717_01790 [Rhodobacteraceae bacterium]|nr:hypothetical protein [Paracoccaceae bacterium]
MTEIADLERRIYAALDRIGAGLDGLGAAAQAPGDDAELQSLREALEAEKTANAQLEERVRSLHQQQGTQVAELEEQTTALKASAQEAKTQTQQLRLTNQHLQASLEQLRDAAAAGVDPHMINQAMMSELDGLRSVRDADRAELDELLGALKPLLKETQDA